MNCSERADNMSKRKLTDYFKPSNNKNVRKDFGSTVQNEPIIETTTSIVCIGVSTPTLKNTTPLFLAKPPSNRQTV